MVSRSSPSVANHRLGRVSSSSWSPIDHPANALLAAHQHEMRDNRVALLREIRKASRPLARVAANVLHKRDSLHPPAIGELWPWLLGDLASIPANDVRQVAKAWLALYIYMVLLDKACDEPDASGVASESLAGALLSEIGVGDFCAMTSGTAWQSVSREAFRSAIRNQEIDTRHARSCENINAKRRSAAGKNAGFLICTSALASVADVDGPALHQFTRSLLLALQHLDDLADFAEDWSARNFTPLLIEAGSELSALEGGDVKRSDILRALIRSGALRAVLKEAQAAFLEALRLLSAHFGEPESGCGGSAFFGGLLLGITRTIEAIDQAMPSLAVGRDRSSDLTLIEEVDERLRIVAQQS